MPPIGWREVPVGYGDWGCSTRGSSNSMGDADGDGFVGSGDLDTVRANWGDTLFAAAVPEPGVLILLGLGLAVWRLWRRDA